MDRAVRVLHVSTPLSWRGGEQQLFYLLKELHHHNQPFSVLCPEQSVLSDKLSASSYAVQTFKKRSGLDWQLAKKVSRIAEPFDIIHAHDSHAHTAAVLANAFFGARKPVLLSRRVDFPVGGSVFSAWKYNHKSVCKIACVSDFIANMLRESLKRPERILTIHSGIDMERFPTQPDKTALHSMLKLDPTIKLVGNVSALADHKDYFTFLRSIKELVGLRPDVKAVIMGTGPMEEEIKAYSKEIGLSREVIFMGFRADLAELLPCLDLLLFTSKTEGLGTSILDAMACKVPVVATRAGGIPEIVIHEKTGLLAEVGDAKMLAALCNRLLDKPQEREVLINQAYTLAKQFDYRQTALAMMELYEQIGRAPLN
jgi:glycosyltransferase involved in cell wall biosynthesis